MTEIKMDNIKHNVCPICSAKIVSYKKYSKHTNGQWNEIVKFKCGCSLHWSPNFRDYTEESRYFKQCPKHPTIKEQNDNKIGWIQGVAWACGFICTEHGRDTAAADMWKESGINNDDAKYAYEYDLNKFRRALPSLPEGEI